MYVLCVFSFKHVGVGFSKCVFDKYMAYYKTVLNLKKFLFFLIVNRKQNSHTRKALTTLPIRFQVYKDVETNGHCM